MMEGGGEEEEDDGDDEEGGEEDDEEEEEEEEDEEEEEEEEDDEEEEEEEEEEDCYIQIIGKFLDQNNYHHFTHLLKLEKFMNTDIRHLPDDRATRYIVRTLRKLSCRQTCSRRWD